MRSPLAALPLLLALACGTDAVPEAAPVIATEAATEEWTQFYSPSGRITCIASTEAAWCEVSAHRWPPMDHSDCELDGDSWVEVRDATAERVCHGDSVFGVEPEPVLAYGDVRTVGDFRCASARSGMTCVNVRTRHGFEVSRASYRVF